MAANAAAEKAESVSAAAVFCRGPLLRAVQEAGLFPDSKVGEVLRQCRIHPRNTARVLSP